MIGIFALIAFINWGCFTQGIIAVVVHVVVNEFGWSQNN